MYNKQFNKKKHKNKNKEGRKGVTETEYRISHFVTAKKKMIVNWSGTIHSRLKKTTRQLNNIFGLFLFNLSWEKR